MATDVRQDFSLETKLADSLAIGARLLGGGGGSEFDVLHAKRIERLGDGDFGLGVKESVGELLSLCTDKVEGNADGSVGCR